MRFLLAVLVLVALVFMNSVPSDATCNTRKGVSNLTTDVDANDIIYDLTIPWPFHRPRTDSDGDGVADSRDKCPDTPSGAVVDMNGCPLDSDGDGVYDGIDACPGTPKGASVDAKGCPMDSDGDGVYDGIDRCPNTPRDLKVDEFGCPIEKTEIETQLLDTGVIRAYNINFETDKADLKQESFKILDEIGTLLVQWPMLQIEIGGHTDSQGSDAYNQKLSEQRAQAVHDYLVKTFPKIESANLTTKGYGEGKSIASNTTAEGRAKNRRVEFTVLNQQTLKKEIEKRKLEKK
ncbi:MAG: OmpA family protein [Chitinivibrionia bacterium]|nr:OmpA family protein [Chitinivibrionia bacterium]